MGVPWCEDGAMQRIEIQAAPLEMLGALLSPGRSERLLSTAARARELLADRVVWTVSATARGWRRGDVAGSPRLRSRRRGGYPMAGA